jgi:hypothetical protein
MRVCEGIFHTPFCCLISILSATLYPQLSPERESSLPVKKAPPPWP